MNRAQFFTRVRVYYFLLLVLTACGGKPETAVSPTPLVLTATTLPAKAVPATIASPGSPAATTPTATIEPLLEVPSATAVPPTSLLKGRSLLVTSAEDSGPNTLYQAFQDAQPYDTITFDPAVFPPDAPATIPVNSYLPGLFQGHLTIDASNAGVILDGRNAAGEWRAGLEIVSSDRNIIRGLQISNFSGAGIAISGDAQYNLIGGDRTIGSGPFGQGNLFSGNDVGVVLSTPGTSFNTIFGNLIGTDAHGAEALGNNTGVWITEGANNNTIGPDNIIAYNGALGIKADDSETVPNTITQNSIHDNLRGDIKPAAPILIDFDLQAGTLTGAACADCTIEIFSGKSDEEAIYEGQTIAESMGVFSFNKGAPFIGPHLTATATALDGKTSEFARLTSGAVRSLIMQLGNDLSRTIFQPGKSRELADNRMGINWGSISDDDNLATALPGLNAAGLKRLDMGLCEKEPPIDWSTGTELAIPAGADEFIDALAEHGIQMDLMLHFWDKEGQALGEELLTPRFQNQKQINDFINFVRFVVRHFKGRIPYYTIWSEPDYCGDGGLKCIRVEDYIEMARQVIPVIREEDPDAKIISTPYTFYHGRISPDFYTFLTSDVVSQFDVISWHPFYDVTPNHDFYGKFYYEYPAIIQEIKQTASTHGFTGEYWGTDLSWNSKEICIPSEGCRDYLASDPRAQGMVETDLQVAKYYTRGIVMELGMDVHVGMDNFMDDRPWSYPTMVNLNTVMAGNKPIELAVEIQSEATNIMSFGFSLPNGDRLFALWTHGVAVDDDPGLPARLTFPSSSAQSVVGFDVLHGFEQELIIETENGSVILRNLLIKDYPIILRMID